MGGAGTLSLHMTTVAICISCRYLRQIAVITPYARFTFTYTGEDARNSVAVTFARRTDKMPPPPQVPLPARTETPTLISPHAGTYHALHAACCMCSMRATHSHCSCFRAEHIS